MIPHEGPYSESYTQQVTQQGYRCVIVVVPISMPLPARPVDLVRLATIPVLEQTTLNSPGEHSGVERVVSGQCPARREAQRRTTRAAPAARGDVI